MNNQVEIKYDKADKTPNQYRMTSNIFGIINYGILEFYR